MYIMEDKNKEVITMKLNITKVLSGVGLVLSVVGTIVSGVAGDRKMKEVVDKVVDAKLKQI